MARVTDDGKVTARKKGKAKITAKSGGKKYVAKVIVNDVPVAEFENGNMDVIESEENIYTYAKKVKVKCEKGKLKVSFVLKGEGGKVPVKITAIPIEGVANFCDGKEVLGSVQSITKGFEIMNLRLEEKASILTLMPFNVKLEGKAIASIAVRKDNKIYYFQTEIRDMDFADLSKYANENKDYHSRNEIKKLQDKYLYMKSDMVTKSKELELELGENGIESFEFANDSQMNITDGNNLEKEQIQEVDDGETIAIMNYLSQIEDNREADLVDTNLNQAVVHSLIPDTIFKYGKVDTWRHYHGGYYCYSYITYRFGGTHNRETYIIFMEVIEDAKKSPYSLALKVLKNMYVYSAPSIKYLGAQDNSRVEVKNLNLSLEAKNEKGFFTSVKYWGITKESTMKKVLEAAGSHIKYVDQLITWRRFFETKDLKTNIKVPLQKTAKKHKKIYGRLINRIDARGKILKYPGDLFVLEGRGKKLKNKVKCRYSYSVRFK